MVKIALIGGTGLDEWGEPVGEQQVETPFGRPSDTISLFEHQDRQLLFLPRHGHRHTIPPHRVNYRANLFALKELGAEAVLAVNAVGGISGAFGPGVLAIPDQLIDYTWGREHSFSFEDGDDLQHAEFAQPFNESLRKQLLKCAAGAGITVVDGGCLGVTQGPRLETAAEVRRMDRDGCSMVGMTSMPEAALARELELPYASICVVANHAAGLDSAPITMAAIESTLEEAMVSVRWLLSTFLEQA